MTRQIENTRRSGPEGLDDSELDALAERARQGDDRARDRLLLAVEPSVRRRCARILPCPQDAEEAAQDALVSVATKLDTFTGVGSFSGWVSVIAANSARSTYRKLVRRAQETPSESLPLRADPRTTSVIAGSRLDLLDALEYLEETHPVLMEAFVLRDLSELTYGEVAGHLGVPLGTVKARVHHARAVVRERLVVR